jgi:hypothetical protein
MRYLERLRAKTQDARDREPTKPTEPPFVGFVGSSSVVFPALEGCEAVDLPDHVGDWPEDWLETFVERAGIMEYDGGLPRIEAERRAEDLVREAYRRTGGAK